MLDFARSLAADASEMLRGARRRLDTRRIELKGRRDLVTDTDRKIESFLAEKISARFPDDAILAEESIRKTGRSGRVWLLDPLDGTTNFVHGHPMVSVSIALAEGYAGPPDSRTTQFDDRACGFFAPENLPQLVLGVVAAPVLGETYWAERGRGAWLDDGRCANGCAGAVHPAGARRLSVSSVDELERALVATGFAYRRNELRNSNLGNFNTLALRVQGIRRGGSAALDLCYVAAGRFDAFWELYLKPWDVAAGMLIVEEAGGRVTDLQGGPRAIEAVEIVASNGRTHEQVRSLLEDPDPSWVAGEREKFLGARKQPGHRP